MQRTAGSDASDRKPRRRIDLHLGLRLCFAIWHLLGCGSSRRTDRRLSGAMRRRHRQELRRTHRGRRPTSASACCDPSSGTCWAWVGGYGWGVLGCAIARGFRDGKDRKRSGWEKNKHELCCLFFPEIGWPEKDTGTMEEPRFRRWQGWDEDKRPGGMMEGEVDVLKLVGYKALRDRQSRVFDFQCREAK